MRRSARRAGAPFAPVVVGAVVIMLVLSGCSSAVDVRLPGAAGSAACGAAGAQWPVEVGGLATVETDPSDPAVHAWGEPAVVARCGVPALGPTTDDCVVVDGVDWVAEDLDDGTRLTTFGRDPAIEVLVPDAHGPAPLLLPAFAEAAAELPRNDLACT